MEAVPRPYLLAGFTALGVGLALAMSLQSGEWWQIRAVASGGASVGQTDPIFQRDASYYLFAIPWTRTLHSFATILAGVMLGVVLILYAAVGAVRVQRRVEVNDEARKRAGFFGRLQPPEGGRAGNTFWWLSSGSEDGVAPLRRISTIQADEPARLAGLVEGRVTSAGPMLTEYRFCRPWELPSPE